MPSFRLSARLATTPPGVGTPGPLTTVATIHQMTTATPTASRRIATRRTNPMAASLSAKIEDPHVALGPWNEPSFDPHGRPVRAQPQDADDHDPGEQVAAPLQLPRPLDLVADAARRADELGRDDRPPSEAQGD